VLSKAAVKRIVAKKSVTPKFVRKLAKKAVKDKWPLAAKWQGRGFFDKNKDPFSEKDMDEMGRWRQGDLTHTIAHPQEQKSGD